MFFFFQAEDGIRDYKVTGVQTCALPISRIEFRGRGVGDGVVARQEFHPRADTPSPPGAQRAGEALRQLVRDRKSTRLNSSHLVISYAVFCLKKKNQKWPVMEGSSM